MVPVVPVPQPVVDDAGPDGPVVAFPEVFELFRGQGSDPREVGDALTATLRDCGVELPESDEAVATIVYTQLARIFLDEALDAQTVSNTASAVLLWTGYPDGIRAMPLGRLLYIDAEWGHQPGRAHKKLAEVVREPCEEQLRIGPVAL